MCSCRPLAVNWRRSDSSVVVVMSGHNKKEILRFGVKSILIPVGRLKNIGHQKYPTHRMRNRIFSGFYPQIGRKSRIEGA